LFEVAAAVRLNALAQAVTVEDFVSESAIHSGIDMCISYICLWLDGCAARAR
jgi:hypothetical protein